MPPEKAETLAMTIPPEPAEIVPALLMPPEKAETLPMKIPL
jgi:hypothetical protein